jgi:hypothetical protein
MRFWSSMPPRPPKRTLDSHAGLTHSTAGRGSKERTLAELIEIIRTEEERCRIFLAAGSRSDFEQAYRRLITTQAALRRYLWEV